MSDPLLSDWATVANGARGKMMEATITDAEYKFWRAWLEYAAKRPIGDLRASELSREICVMPFSGAYGQAGVVLTINGSPPRCMMVITTDLGPGESRICIVGTTRASMIYANRPARGQALRRAVFALLVERGAVPEWWKPSKYEDDRKPDSLDYYMGE